MSDTAEKRFRSQIATAYPGSQVLAITRVLWSGWEMDELAAVVSTGGAPLLVTTDHGRLDRAWPQFLKSRIADYVEVLASSRAALALLMPDDGSVT